MVDCCLIGLVIEHVQIKLDLFGEFDLSNLWAQLSNSNEPIKPNWPDLFYLVWQEDLYIYECEKHVSID